MKTTLERMQTVLAIQLGLDEHEIKPESRIVADLGADSLDAVEIVMAVEEEWNLSTEIDDDEAMKIETVADAVKLVDSIISVNVPRQVSLSASGMGDSSQQNNNQN